MAHGNSEKLFAHLDRHAEVILGIGNVIDELYHNTTTASYQSNIDTIVLGFHTTPLWPRAPTCANEHSLTELSHCFCRQKGCTSAPVGSLLNFQTTATEEKSKAETCFINSQRLSR